MDVSSPRNIVAFQVIEMENKDEYNVKVHQERSPWLKRDVDMQRLLQVTKLNLFALEGKIALSFVECSKLSLHLM